MLPNWLLGKSKSKLQEILGGGGGGTDYTAGDGIDISDGVISFDPLTAPAIDPSKVEGLDDDLAALAPKTALSNHNILHNPWFNVNQRSVTSLTASGKIADRWGITGNGSWTVARTSEGYLDIDNSNNENTLYLLQKRTSTYLTSLLGYPLTASVMFSDGTIVSGTKPTSDGTVYVDTDDIAITRNYQSEIFNVNIKPGKHVIIKAVKLEVGEISTLHLDPRPEYATELAKCQRYFQRIGGEENHLLGIGYASSATRIDLPIFLPAVIRGVIPTITLTGSLKIGFGGSLTSSTIALIGLDRSILAVNITTSGRTPGSAERISWTAGSYIDVDAEL